MTATDQFIMRTIAHPTVKPKPTVIAILAFIGMALLCRQPIEAASQWEAITLADQGMFYIDQTSIVREGSIRKFHSALDHKTIQSTSDGKPFWSNETHVQIDCNSRQARVVHLKLYSGRMLTGNPVLKEGILREWQPITPTSAMEKLARRVC
ncbi:MAG: surface-adhesin E family protein [Betaproteobacteria bacterium]